MRRKWCLGSIFKQVPQNCSMKRWIMRICQTITDSLWSSYFLMKQQSTFHAIIQTFFNLFVKYSFHFDVNKVTLRRKNNGPYWSTLGWWSMLRIWPEFEMTKQMYIKLYYIAVSLRIYSKDVKYFLEFTKNNSKLDN